MKRRSSLGGVPLLGLVALTLAGCSDRAPSQHEGGNAGGSDGQSAGGVTSLVSVPNEEDVIWTPEARGLAPRPPMGWNSWNSFAAGVDAELIMRSADALVESGMKDAGYEYVNIDDGWARRTRTETDDGTSVIEADPDKFPPGPNGESGIQVVADYVHEKGLKLGIYSDRGSATCGGFAASGDHEPEDAQTFASWGVDYLKYDSCNAPTDPASREQQYTAMRHALDAVERPIVYSICSWQFDEWNLETGHLWRTTGDIGKSFTDKNAIASSSKTILQVANANSVYAAYQDAGGWNDADMLEVGNLGTSASANSESRAHFSLWAMMSAPLIAGNDLTAMTEETRTILTNPDVIAVDQDALGLSGVPVRSMEGAYVWAKPLARSGSRAVVLLNTTTSPQPIAFSLQEIGLGAGSATARNLWQPEAADLDFVDSSAPEVPARSALMYEVRGNEPALPNGTAELSDLTWTYAANALGPAERDQSNGGRSQGDGSPLSIRGSSFDKGLGVAAGSKIIFRLAGKCSRFQSVIGLDDSAGAGGSVVFKVFADGEQLYPKGEPTVFDASADPQELDLDLSGKHRLTLLVTSAGDGDTNDRADWADAKITCAP